MAPENVKVITNIYIMYNLYEREALLVFTNKNRGKLFMWRNEIQTYCFAVHFLFNRNKILCIYIKVHSSDFQLISKMLVFLFYFDFPFFVPIYTFFFKQTATILYFVIFCYFSYNISFFFKHSSNFVSCPLFQCRVK